MDSQPDFTPGRPVTGRTRDMVIAADRAILGLARHWLLVFNLAVFLYVGLPFLAPVLMQAGARGPARAIYTLYGGLCHQFGYRSWFLFGERSAYPRDVFELFTGIDANDPDNMLAARAYVGDEHVGFKVALCERDVAIYATLLGVGLIYALPFVRARVRPLPWPAYLLVGLVPIGLDGFSQLLSQYPFDLLPFLAWLPYRESTPLLRTLTGGLFGLANGWLALPYLHESMSGIRADLEAKLARVDAGHAAAAGG